MTATLERPARAPRSLVVPVALLTVTLWAGTVIATKLAVGEMEPLAVALLRAWLAGLLALPLALLSLKERPRGARPGGVSRPRRWVPMFSGRFSWPWA